MHTYLIDMLECPSCHGDLEWTITERNRHRVEMADVSCTACTATYPVREGIAVFLTPDLLRDDLWQHTESHLSGYLREHPDIEYQLMQAPLGDLAPADQFFRALILEERGRFAESKAAFDTARHGLYTPEYLTSLHRQTEYALQILSGSDGPVVDLASGMGHLVEQMARRFSRLIVATDFSPSVLRRNRQRFTFSGLYDRITLMAFDARRTPFRDGAVKTLTTFQGLANISEPGDMLGELRRIVSDIFLAMTIFYPEEDDINKAAIREMGLSDLLFHRPALDCFAAAGWQADIVDSFFGKARPTPSGVILEGVRIDGLPVSDTTLEYGVIAAKPAHLQNKPC